MSEPCRRGAMAGLAPRPELGQWPAAPAPMGPPAHPVLQAGGEEGGRRGEHYMTRCCAPCPPSRAQRGSRGWGRVHGPQSWPCMLQGVGCPRAPSRTRGRCWVGAHGLCCSAGAWQRGGHRGRPVGAFASASWGEPGKGHPGLSLAVGLTSPWGLLGVRRVPEVSMGHTGSLGSPWG